MRRNFDDLGLIATVREGAGGVVCLELSVTDGVDVGFSVTDGAGFIL